MSRSVLPSLLGGRASRAVTRRGSGRALGLVLGVGLDLLLADPRRGHPVAAFGRSATALESRIWADDRARGAVYAAACLAAAIGFGVVGQRLTDGSRPARAGVVALGAWTVIGGTGLSRAAAAMADALGAGDLDAARCRLPALCGRDPRTLDEPGLARATVESVAENTSDAVVAPLVWGAVAGLPGLLGYRAVNTLDAMVGHRSDRYRSFGWAAARLDDVANLVPARLTGLLAVACAPIVGGAPRDALRAMVRDGSRHPSPNAGRCEAAFAGALGRTLGGVTTYRDGDTERTERRGPLGTGPAPGVDDINRAVRLSRAVALAAVSVAALGVVLADRPAR